jgi:hypothetical protein
MVAIPRLACGEAVGGIHRTCLLEDGSGKAPAGKKMLGAIAEAAVRLFPIAEEGHLGIAEGIETALAAHAIFSQPVWAALSADGLARFRWPEGTRCVTIYADAGDAGRQAAATLSDRLNIADTRAARRRGWLGHGCRAGFSRVLKKSARRNGFPFALAAAFSVEPFDADGVRA